MKAISDLNGFDIKVHSNEIEKVFDCLYSWYSETLKIHRQDPPLKLMDDFFRFNTQLFDEKAAAFGSIEVATNYIKKLPIPEYIAEIREHI